MLIEHLKDDDINLRVTATRNLPAIADALGPERVRAELVPFINDSTDDEDEVLLCMAEQVGKLTTHVGGKQYAHELLVPLEQLAAVDESTVREKALESIQTVARCLSAEQLTDHMVPLLSRLTRKEWFTARMSACCLAPPTYALLLLLLPPPAVPAAAPAPAAGGDGKEAAGDVAGDPGSAARAEVRELFKKLCRDDTPMVRRCAGEGL
ncbi:unnamed protein product, partial [Hapterophycus canaliculatus]